MTTPEITAYDEILYPNRAFPQSHPERLATIATLLGMNPALPRQCRVLEMGCGRGGNLVPMAYDLPESEFVGLDIAARPIALGQEDIAALGLKNLSLVQQNLMDVTAAYGTFDYIIAHGVYSWTPAAVRDRVLAICRKYLAPQGVAFISFVAYPGAYLIRMTRDMMRFHMQHFDGSQHQLRQARAMLKLLVDAQPEDTLYHAVLEDTYQRVGMYSDEYLYHDDLSENYASCYFHEFIDHAGQHQLQYLAEAVFFETFGRTFSPEVTAALEKLGSDFLLKQQYLDFLNGRKFRQALLCHQEVPLEREALPSGFSSLYVAAPVSEVSLEGGEAEATKKFEGLRSSFVETDQPLSQEALRCLGEQWPAFVSVDTLMEVAQERSAAKAPVDPEAFGKAVLQLYQTNFLEMYLDNPPFVTQVSDRPVASPIARFQIQFSPYISTLSYGSLQVTDAMMAILLPLLDGTHDQEDLLKILLAYRAEGALILKQGDTRVANEQEAAEVLRARLAATLHELAQQALLLA